MERTKYADAPRRSNPRRGRCGREVRVIVPYSLEARMRFSFARPVEVGSQSSRRIRLKRLLTSSSSTSSPRARRRNSVLNGESIRAALQLADAVELGADPLGGALALVNRFGGRALRVLDKRSPGVGLGGRSGPIRTIAIQTVRTGPPNVALSLLVDEQQRYGRTDRLDRHADLPPSPCRHPGSATGTGRERVERKP
jgi:hypothetical protein